MRITGARDLGLYVRDRRRDLAMTQSSLAEVARVSRRWLVELESGKETARLDLVIRVLDALGLVLEARPDTSTSHTDLDRILDELRGPTGG